MALKFLAYSLIVQLLFCGLSNAASFITNDTELNNSDFYFHLKDSDTTIAVLPSTRSSNLQLNSLDEQSIARIWNEVLLESIRNDFARPTVHARNLFHTSIAMYDAWAIYDESAKPYLMGTSLHGFTNTLQNFTPTESLEISRRVSISYAVYRLLNHRFKDSPNYSYLKSIYDNLMTNLGLNISFVSTDYTTGSAAALGNYIAQTIIAYGMEDGSREQSGYDNAFYSPSNDPLNPILYGNPTISDPNKWQPLSLDTYIDQSGNLITGDVIPFLSPEWGSVYPFALKEEDKTVFNKDGDLYTVYHDPGNPPYINTTELNKESDFYKWGFSMVAAWSSHLDSNDDTLWDISPNSIGNLSIEDLPKNYSNYPNFYDFEDGGDNSPGHAMNPSTGLPYESQIVKRGDYTRVLAEFWADGPDSETPPGHWFTILNYVNDNPLLVKKFAGQGEVLDDLEWDVKSYFILSGAMHDVAITAWGIKGYYDYLRPISAIRYMQDQGQSTDPNLPNYSITGIPLKEGYIELIEEGDPLAGGGNYWIGRIKLYSWKGPDYINDPITDAAGVDWIWGDTWWPYQRPSFVTPPFAGFVSGHSTFSRAAAEVLTLITGDAYFPGGMGEFVAKQNEFLVFEEGPSEDIILQWATYRDASDQCSLSRIWGGIHPPADDIPGRLIGYEIGHDAFNFAVAYFDSSLSIEETNTQTHKIYPNPVTNKEIYITNINSTINCQLFDIHGREIPIIEKEFISNDTLIRLKFPDNLSSGIYLLRLNDNSRVLAIKDN